MTNIRIIGLSLLTATLFSAKAYAGCEKDTDCKGDRICEAQVCVNPTASPAPAPPPEAATTSTEKDAKTESTETQDSTSAPAETADAPPVKEESPKETDPKDWWKKSVRETEAAVLQEIFETV
ncbi:MAG: hypothetical protein ACPGTU_04700, partial [Myxococcota bacterium]